MADQPGSPAPQHVAVPGTAGSLGGLTNRLIVAGNEQATAKITHSDLALLRSNVASHSQSVSTAQRELAATLAPEDPGEPEKSLPRVVSPASEGVKTDSVTASRRLTEALIGLGEADARLRQAEEVFEQDRLKDARKLSAAEAELRAQEEARARDEHENAVWASLTDNAVSGDPSAPSPSPKPSGSAGYSAPEATGVTPAEASALPTQAPATLYVVEAPDLPAEPSIAAEAVSPAAATTVPFHGPSAVRALPPLRAMLAARRAAEADLDPNGPRVAAPRLPGMKP